MKVYLIGSMRNPCIPEIAIELRRLGFDVFDDWFSPGDQADEKWQAYEQQRGRTYHEALKGYHARQVLAFDKQHLDETDCAVLALPAGKSGHLELGYIIGRGKPGYVLLNGEPDRFDIMLGLATAVFPSTKDLYAALQNLHCS